MCEKIAVKRSKSFFKVFVYISIELAGTMNVHLDFLEL